MKTTIELPDELFLQAKAVATRRRTTLRAIMEHALRREIQDLRDDSTDSRYEKNEMGFLVLRPRPGETVTSETIQKIQDEMDKEELDHALKTAGKR